MLRRAAGQVFLSVFGWKKDGAPPSQPGYVLIAAPHTSNWDFPVTLAMAWVYDVPIRWMGKHTLFEGPFAPFFRWAGGVPVIRHERRNMVDQMAALFAEDPSLVLVVPAEGTRRRTERWKSGFYHIARKAGVPIVLGFLDFHDRRGGFGPAIEPTDDLSADMDRIRTFYADKKGKRPELFGPIRLAEEMPSEDDGESPRA